MSPTPELQVLPEVRSERRAAHNRAYCRHDRWGVDPRYTVAYVAGLALR